MKKFIFGMLLASMAVIGMTSCHNNAGKDTDSTAVDSTVLVDSAVDSVAVSDEAPNE